MIQNFNNFFETCGTFIKIVLLSKFSSILKYKIKDSNSSLLILGNGPSLNTTLSKYSEKIQNHELLCVNSFVFTDHFKKLKPKFYILAAPSYFKEDKDLSQHYIDFRDKTFKCLNEKTEWELVLMVPMLAKKSKEFSDLLEQNENIKPIYYNPTPGGGLKGISNFIYSKGWAMPRPHNVLIPAIMCSIKIQFKKIFIVGADHSWLGEISVNEKNEALVHQKHFYDENTSKPKTMQDYIVRPRRLHEVLHKFYLSFKGYWDIKLYAEKMNVKIINCSEESMIDAFERGKL